MKAGKVFHLLLGSAGLLAVFASRAPAQNHGVLIAMGGGNGTPEIYETWRTLGGGKDAHVVLIPTANNPGEDIAPVINGLKHVFGVQDVNSARYDRPR
jgi:hypothetical protein